MADFNATTRTFSGTPAVADVETLAVEVTASDGTDSVTDTFDIVVSAATAACPAPDFGRTRANIWTGVVTVEMLSGGHYGFQAGSPGAGALDNTTFTTSNGTYTIDAVSVVEGGTYDGDLAFSLTNDLDQFDLLDLRLHVCDTAYDFSTAMHLESANTYMWPRDLDWSGETSLTLYLSVPNDAATGTPAISGTAEAGRTLTASTSGIADANGLTGVSFSYQWIREDANGMNQEDIDGATSSTYTLATADIGKRIRVRVEFTDQVGGEESVISDAFPDPGTVTAGTIPPAFSGATVDGTSLVITFDKTLAPASSLANSAFTVKRTPSGGSEETVTLSAAQPPAIIGVTVTLTLVTPVVSTDRLTVSYTRPESGTDNKLEDASGNEVESFTDESVTHNKLPTGVPYVGGLPIVREKVYAHPWNIRDADGRPGSREFAYQWFRVDDEGVDTEIAGAAAREYTLTPDEQGKRVRVRVSYTDHRGTPENVTSPAWPRGAQRIEAATTGPGTVTISNFEQPRAGVWAFLTGGTVGAAFNFTTGDEAGGYELDAVHLLVQSGIDFTTSVCETSRSGRARGWPRTSACTVLERPSPFEAGSAQEFSAPANTPLEAGTTYAIVLSGYETALSVRQARTGAVDPGSASDWEIDDVYRLRRSDGWRRVNRGRTPVMAVTVKAPSAQMAEEHPSIAETPGISEPGPDGAWTVGEQIRFTFTFDEAVEVDTTGGTPAVGFTLGSSGERTAEYTEGSGTHTLVFSYTVTAEDGSQSSVLLGGNALGRNGGTIRSVATGADARLGHDGAGKQGVRAPDNRGTPFTAALHGVPDGHDGSSPFDVEVRFSRAPDALEKGADAADVLDVTGATVESTGTAGNQGRTWSFRLTPSGNADITVAVPVRACTATAALCARGQPLASAVDATVPWVRPFTGSFTSAPAEHDGASRFDVVFEFSEQPGGASWRSIRDHAFTTTGGTITRARRTGSVWNKQWTLTVNPNGDAPVTLTLRDAVGCEGERGMCTSDGRVLQGGASVTILGPAMLSVADAEAQEAQGATLDFVVSLSRARTDATTVAYATSNGSATAGDDYEETAGTLTFPAGETSRTVPVTVLDDAHDEGSETMTLTLSNPVGAKLGRASATGTIENDDQMPQAWIARFGRTVAEQVLEAVEGRMQAGRAPGAELSLAGQRIGLGPVFGGDAGSGDGPDAAAAQAEAQTAQAATRLTAWLAGETPGSWSGTGGAGDPEPLGEARTRTARELLLGSSFALTAAADGPGGGTVSLWGRAAVSRFDGREGDLSLDGEVTSGLLGADWIRERAAAGLIMGHSRGEGGYRAQAGGGTVTSTLTGLYPWGRYAVNERVSVWGVAGYGEGALTLTPDGQPAMRTDLDLVMGAVGLRGVVVQAPAAGGPELAVKTDALGVRTTTARVRGLDAAQADATRLRLGLEGSWAMRFEGGAAFTPSLEVGVRHDGGDAETGFGADIGGGLAWSDPQRGLSAELRGRGLLSHEAEGFRERGLSGTFSFDPRPDSSRGLALTLSQTLGGASSGGMDALLGRGTLEGLAADDDGGELANRRFEMRLGYGFAAFGDRFTLTPEAGVGLSNGSRDYSLGWRIVRDARPVDIGSLELALEARRHENDGAAPGTGAEHTVGVRLSARLWVRRSWRRTRPGPDRRVRAGSRPARETAGFSSCASRTGVRTARLPAGCWPDDERDDGGQHQGVHDDERRGVASGRRHDGAERRGPQHHTDEREHEHAAGCETDLVHGHRARYLGKVDAVPSDRGQAEGGAGRGQAGERPRVGEPHGRHGARDRADAQDREQRTRGDPAVAHPAPADPGDEAGPLHHCEQQPGRHQVQSRVPDQVRDEEGEQRQLHRPVAERHQRDGAQPRSRDDQAHGQARGVDPDAVPGVAVVVEPRPQRLDDERRRRHHRARERNRPCPAEAFRDRREQHPGDEPAQRHRGLLDGKHEPTPVRRRDPRQHVARPRRREPVAHSREHRAQRDHGHGAGGGEPDPRRGDHDARLVDADPAVAKHQRPAQQREERRAGERGGLVEPDRRGVDVERCRDLGSEHRHRDHRHRGHRLHQHHGRERREDGTHGQRSGRAGTPEEVVAATGAAGRADHRRRVRPALRSGGRSGDSGHISGVRTARAPR